MLYGWNSGWNSGYQYPCLAECTSERQLPVAGRMLVGTPVLGMHVGTLYILWKIYLSEFWTECYTLALDHMFFSFMDY